MQNNLKRAVLFSAFSVFIVAGCNTASAMDWLAERLRGDVYRVEDREWVPVSRGDVVPSGTVVWTTRNAFVDFRSGENLVSLTPETQVKFIERTAQDQNWVQLWFGEVDVDVEARNVEHFAVQTPYMVAVVKGTAFSVTSDDNGAEVSVQRGSVAVRDTSSNHNVTLGAGQNASGGTARGLSVSGTGTLPVVVDARGNPVITAASNRPGNSGNTNSGGNNSGNADGARPSNTPASGGPSTGSTNASGSASSGSANASGSASSGSANASGSASSNSSNSNGNAGRNGKP